ncbi:hypothetical protein AOQ88_02245 [Candidatus Riesia sp. GBBU]|nr:hypothetical protein AOQ88_02205 [Candidatus Riesia sp. GBBU]ARC55043.1 hypothetical protein AOQ88_02245 [Candidatus Riesia sp. GBBU]
MCLYTILIKKLSVFTIIGVHKWERQVKQKVLIDLLIKYKLSSSRKKSENNYLDYYKISSSIIEGVENKEFLLLEDLVNNIMNILMERFVFYKVRIRACKLNAVYRAKKVCVVLSRKIDF